MLESADAKRRTEGGMSSRERNICLSERVGVITWASKGQHQRRHGVEGPDGESKRLISSHKNVQ